MASSTMAAAFFGSAPYSSWSAVTLPAPKQRLSRPLDRWSRNASRLATWAGWCWLRQTGAGPRRMRLVSPRARAMKISGITMFSYFIV